MAAVDMDRIKAHAQRFADGFTPGQKSLTILGVVGVVVAMFYFNTWASSTEYAALYTQLESSDASQVTSELDARGVSYKLEDGGRTVLVPRSEVYQTRVDLSAEGLPSGGQEGFVLLDEGGITKSQFSQTVDYQRALQGELGKTIEYIDGVATARVMLTIPRENVFVGSEEERATASVLVEPTGGTQLPAESVQAIVNIVSSGVADMTPEDVTVADSLGNVLSAPGQSGGAMVGEQLEQQNAMEENIATSVRNLIAASLGPGHAAVTVQTDLDFSKTSTISVEHPEPADGTPIPKNSETTTESFTGSPGGATGLLGPDGTPVDTGETPTVYEKTETVLENAVDEVTSTINEAPGRLERMSVSVLLDSEVVTTGDVADWEDAISAAAGIDATRSDTLNVALMEFDTEALAAVEAQLKGAAADQSKDSMLGMIKSIVTLLIVGIVLFLAWRAIKRSEANRIPLRVPLDLRELEAGDLVSDQLETRRVHAAVGAGGGGGGGDRPPILEAHNLPVEDEVAGIIEQQPDEVALTLRSWLADRRT